MCTLGQRKANKAAKCTCETWLGGRYEPCCCSYSLTTECANGEDAAAYTLASDVALGGLPDGADLMAAETAQTQYPVVRTGRPAAGARPAAAERGGRSRRGWDDGARGAAVGAPWRTRGRDGECSSFIDESLKDSSANLFHISEIRQKEQLLKSVMGTSAGTGRRGVAALHWRGRTAAVAAVVGSAEDRGELLRAYTSTRQRAARRKCFAVCPRNMVSASDYVLLCTHELVDGLAGLSASIKESFEKMTPDDIDAGFESFMLFVRKEHARLAEQLEASASAG
eukprot:1291712-Pleurochrysis_carterae.AAC.3